MRIDIDSDLENELDEIKRKEMIYGKGHTETIRILAKHYKTTNSIELLIRREMDQLQSKMEASVKAALKSVFTNILS